MKKIIIYFFTFMFIGLFSACSEDKLGDSIFDTTPPQRSEFDKWLLDNYVRPYNIELKYRFEDIESDMAKHLVPADLDKAKKMSRIIKYAWIEAYNEVAPVTFIKAIAPKVIHFIGSPGYNANGSWVAGTAEGGMKITLYDINSMKYPVDPIQINDNYFHVMHHEFAHILHQTKNYDPDFKKISDGKYVADEWVQDPYNNPKNAHKRGFVTTYAQTFPDEDFVETFSIYITYSPARWNALLVDAEAEGAAIINNKLAFVSKYLDSVWGIDLNKLKDVVQKRSNDLPSKNLDEL